MSTVSRLNRPMPARLQLVLDVLLGVFLGCLGFSALDYTVHPPAAYVFAPGTGWDACARIDVRVDPDTSDHLVTHLQQAVDRWMQAGAPVSLTVTRTALPAQYFRPEPGTIPVYVMDELPGDGHEGALAMGGPVPSRDGTRITAGFIAIKTSTVTDIDLDVVLEHELGHTLGLEHTRTGLMRPNVDPDATVSAADIARLTTLSGTCPTTHR